MKIWRGPWGPQKKNHFETVSLLIFSNFFKKGEGRRGLAKTFLILAVYLYQQVFQFFWRFVLDVFQLWNRFWTSWIGVKIWILFFYFCIIFSVFDPWPAIIDHLTLEIDAGKPGDRRFWLELHTVLIWYSRSSRMPVHTKNHRYIIDRSSIDHPYIIDISIDDR